MGLFKKSGGGFLNGVNGVIESITFDSKEWPGEKGKDGYTTLSAEVKVKQDGADDAVSQFLPAGFLYEDMSISDDGKTIEGGNDGPVIAENSEFAKFVQSAVDNGVPESDLDENGRNFEGLEGWRVTFKKEVNKERQMAAGRKKLGAKAKTATEEEVMLAGRRQDKNDKKKFYNHDLLLVGAVLEKEGGAAAAPAGKSTKSAKTTKAAPKGKAAKGGDDTDYDAADNLLTELLADAKGNTINKASISSLIVRKAVETDMDEATRDALRKLIGSDEFLNRENGWTFKPDEKGAPVSLAKRR